MRNYPVIHRRITEKKDGGGSGFRYVICHILYKDQVKHIKSSIAPDDVTFHVIIFPSNKLIILILIQITHNLFPSLPQSLSNSHIATRPLITGRRAARAPKWRPRTPDLPHYGSGVWLGLRTCAREWPRNILHLLNVWRHTYLHILRVPTYIMGGYIGGFWSEMRPKTLF